MAMKRDTHRPLCRANHRRHVPRSLARRIAGWGMIVLALLGFVLPILPGFVFLMMGILLLGPYDPTLRRTALALRLALRRWSKARQRHIRSVGAFVRRRYRDTRLMLRARVRDSQAGMSGLIGHGFVQAMLLMGVAAMAGLTLVLLQTIR